ncbi:MAG TPA: LysR family transcriptional regulator [Hyphomicrobiaceae bacterium]|nr:LysR family transcriptional regulator [Hyphomicrobiaceae bacterium]
MMEFQQLRTFERIAAAEGVTRAAALLNLSQPAVTRQMQALEAELGLTLFRRRGRSVQLTEHGADLLVRVRAILADVAALRDRAEALGTGRSGRLTVGATPPMIEGLLAAFLPVFKAEHPEVEIEIIEDGGARLADLVDRGEVTIAYVPAGDDRLEGRLLYPVHVCAVLGRGHELAREASLDIARLADAPLLLLRRGFASRDWFDRACFIAGVYPRVALESASHGVVLNLVRAGYGVGVLPSAIASATPGLKLVPLTRAGQGIGRWTMLAWKSGRVLPSYVQLFVDALAGYARLRFPGRSIVRATVTIPKPGP